MVHSSQMDEVAVYHVLTYMYMHTCTIYSLSMCLCKNTASDVLINCSANLNGLDATGNNVLKLVDAIAKTCNIGRVTLIDLSQVKRTDPNCPAELPLAFLHILQHNNTW